MLTDRQKQPQESSFTNTSTVSTSNEEEPHVDDKKTENQEQDKDVKGEPEDVLPAPHHREKSDIVSPRTRSRERNMTQVSDRREGLRHRPKALRGRGAHKAANSRRGGRGLRPGTRRESGSNNVAVPPLLPTSVGLPVGLLNTGNGLLPLPGSGLLTHLQVRLNADIQSLQSQMKKTAVQILTNPPPVPGEHVPDYPQDKHRQQPSTRHGGRGGRSGPQDSRRMSERHPPKRPHAQSNVPAARNIVRPLLPELSIHKAAVPSHNTAASSDDLPNWLQRTINSVDNNIDQEENTNKPNQEANVIKTGGEVSQYETTENTCRLNDAPPPGVQNDYNSSTLSEIEKSRLARESRNSTDHDVEMQALTSKRKSPFHGEDVPHGGKIVVTTSPEGLPQPGPARGWKTHLKGYCFKQLNTGHCTFAPCKYRHLSNTELLEVCRRFLICHYLDSLSLNFQQLGQDRTGQEGGVW